MLRKCQKSILINVKALFLILSLVVSSSYLLEADNPNSNTISGGIDALTTTNTQVIRDYITHLEVLPSGELKVKEEIDYDFGNRLKHGILRDIPKTIKPRGVSHPINLNIDSFKVSMDSHRVNWQKESIYSSSSGDNIRIKIGNPNRRISGLHHYTISYIVHKGVTLATDGKSDAVRWNILGTGWRVPVLKFKADILLPPALSSQNVKVHTRDGRYKETKQIGDIKWLDPHHLTLNAKNIAPHEGISIFIEYPSGLLQQRGVDNIKTGSFDSFDISISSILLLIYLFIIRLFAKQSSKKTSKGAISPQYYPPKGLSLLQSALIYDKFSRHKDFPAGVVELAQKGYLTLHKEDRLEPFVKRTDKKIGDELTIDQRYLLNDILFSLSNTFSFSTQIPSNRERLASKLDKLDSILYDWSVNDGYFKKDPSKARRNFIIKSILVALPILAISFLQTMAIGDIEMLIIAPFVALFLGIGVIMLWSAWKKRSISQAIFGFIWTVFSSFIFLGGFLSNYSLQEIILGPVGLISTMIMIVAYYFQKVGPFTIKGLQTHQYLLGLKEFISRVEKDKIKRFIKEDPYYLDKLLPYAMLFKFTKAWQGLYKELDVQTPIWYDGDFYDLDSYSQDIESSTTPPSSDNGGFSGGGDFSGGGGGGGGGDSW